MQLARRHFLGNYRLTRKLGLKGTGKLVTDVWPVWDSIAAGAMYYRGESRFASTVLADQLGLNSRVVPLPPPTQLMAETEGLFPDKGLARRCRVGPWECVWLGEVPNPVRIMALRDVEVGVFPTSTLDLLQVGCAAGNASFNSHTKWLAIEDHGGPIEVAFELSEMLGYEPADHSWIPESWLSQPVEPGFNLGYETAIAADGLPVTLRYFTARVNECSVYLPRLWFGDRVDAGALKVELPAATE